MLEYFLLASKGAGGLEAMRGVHRLFFDLEQISMPEKIETGKKGSKKKAKFEREKWWHVPNKKDGVVGILGRVAKAAGASIFVRKTGKRGKSGLIRFDGQVVLYWTDQIIAVKDSPLFPNGRRFWFSSYVGMMPINWMRPWLPNFLRWETTKDGVQRLFYDGSPLIPTDEFVGRASDRFVLEADPMVLPERFGFFSLATLWVWSDFIRMFAPEADAVNYGGTELVFADLDDKFVTKLQSAISRQQVLDYLDRAESLKRRTGRYDGVFEFYVSIAQLIMKEPGAGNRSPWVAFSKTVHAREQMLAKKKKTQDFFAAQDEDFFTAIVG